MRTVGVTAPKDSQVMALIVRNLNHSVKDMVIRISVITVPSGASYGIQTALKAIIVLDAVCARQTVRQVWVTLVNSAPKSCISVKILRLWYAQMVRIRRDFCATTSVKTIYKDSIMFAGVSVLKVPSSAVFYA